MYSDWISPWRNNGEQMVPGDVQVATWSCRQEGVGQGEQEEVSVYQIVSNTKERALAGSHDPHEALRSILCSHHLKSSLVSNKKQGMSL